MIRQRESLTTDTEFNSSISLPNVRFYHDPELFGATPSGASRRREIVESIHEQYRQRRQRPNDADDRKRMRQLALQTSSKIRYSA